MATLANTDITNKVTNKKGFFSQVNVCCCIPLGGCDIPNEVFHICQAKGEGELKEKLFAICGDG